MTASQVQVGRGWRDKIPPDVRKVLELHDGQGKLAVLVVHADAHLEGFQGCGDTMFYGHAQDVEAVAMAFQAVSNFLATLQRGEVDVVSLIFVNFQPKTFSLSPRPDATVAVVATVVEGLRHFLEAVVGSVSGEGMWSLCEWAMVSWTRQE
jgi:hypothetical protein